MPTDEDTLYLIFIGIAVLIGTVIGSGIGHLIVTYLQSVSVQQ